MTYLELANSPLLFFMCLIPVAVIVFQASRLMQLAYKQGKSIGMSPENLKKSIRASISISILPAISLVTLLIAMAPSIGKFFPWLRLSNIGAGGYEPMAAELAMQATGAGSYAALTLTGLLTVYMVMNLGMSVAPVVTLVSLKSFDKTLRKSKATNPFLTIGTNAAFLAVIARLSVPYFVNYKAKLPFASVITGLITSIICYFIGKKIRFFKDFSLTFSIVMGVIVCIILAQLGVK